VRQSSRGVQCLSIGFSTGDHDKPIPKANTAAFNRAVFSLPEIRQGGTGAPKICAACACSRIKCAQHQSGKPRLQIGPDPGVFQKTDEIGMGGVIIGFAAFGADSDSVPLLQQPADQRQMKNVFAHVVEQIQHVFFLFQFPKQTIDGVILIHEDQRVRSEPIGQVEAISPNRAVPGTAEKRLFQSIAAYGKGDQRVKTLTGIHDRFYFRYPCWQRFQRSLLREDFHIPQRFRIRDGFMNKGKQHFFHLAQAAFLNRRFIQKTSHFLQRLRGKPPRCGR